MALLPKMTIHQSNPGHCTTKITPPEQKINIPTTKAHVPPPPRHGWFSIIALHKEVSVLPFS